MRSVKKQRGMTAVGWLLVLALVLLFAIIFIKLVPAYIDGFKIYTALESVESDMSAKGKSVTELRTLINKRLDIDMVKLDPADLSFSRDRNGTKIELDHEIRRQLFGNMYVVLVFQKTVVVQN